MARRVLAVVVVLVAAVWLATYLTSPAVPPDRPPDVTGVVAGGPEAPALGSASDPYYEGMWLLRGDPAVVGADGRRLDADALVEGAGVEVWVQGGCAESFPVQCPVVAVRVR